MMRSSKIWSALGAETWNVKSGVGIGMGTSTSPEKYQSKTSATPSFASATYPSRDIDMIATTLVMAHSFPGRGAPLPAAHVVGMRECAGMSLATSLSCTG